MQNFYLEQATKAATTTKTPVEMPQLGHKQLIVTFSISAAERDSADETYDLFITTGDGVATWDIAHFPQIVSTGAKQFVARIGNTPSEPINVSTAAPGVAAVDSATLATVAGGTNVVGSLGVGLVRHGPWGDRLGYHLVITGAIVTGIAFTIHVQAY